MEDLELKHALRRYVSTAEPPFSLTAESLLTHGRRHRRWRLGMSLGAGGAAATVAIVGTINLVPLASGPPTLDAERCSVPLAANWSPMPSGEPVQPTPSTEQTPWPTSEPTPTPTPWPTSEPSSWPSSDARWPTVAPTPWPTNDPTPWPTDEATPWPTDEATPWPTDEATPWPTDEATPWPTAAPPADHGRMQALSCFLAEELKAMLPGATFAPTDDGPPLSVRGDDWGYVTDAIVINDGHADQLTVSVGRSQFTREPTLGSGPWTYREENGKLIRYYRVEWSLSVEVYTDKTSIFITAIGDIFDAEQLVSLATAPELDIFR